MLDSILNFLVSNAYAADAPVQQGSSISFFVMIALFIGFIYFAVWRPQSKRAREQQTLLSSIAAEDEVITAGGILGKINKVTDQYILLKITDNVEMTLQKSSVISILPKGTLKSID